MVLGVLNAMVPRLWLYLRYWWNEVYFSSATITFDRLYTVYRDRSAQLTGLALSQYTLHSTSDSHFMPALAQHRASIMSAGFGYSGVAQIPKLRRSSVQSHQYMYFWICSHDWLWDDLRSPNYGICSHDWPRDDLGHHIITSVLAIHSYMWPM